MVLNLSESERKAYIKENNRVRQKAYYDLHPEYRIKKKLKMKEYYERTKNQKIVLSL